MSKDNWSDLLSGKLQILHLGKSEKSKDELSQEPSLIKIVNERYRPNLNVLEMTNSKN